MLIRSTNNPFHPPVRVDLVTANCSVKIDNANVANTKYVALTPALNKK